MLFCLRLASIRILSCFFFLLLVILSNCFIIPVVKEKIKVKIEPTIPIGTPTTLTEEIIQTPRLAAERTIKMFVYVIKSSMFFFDYFLS